MLERCPSGSQCETFTVVEHPEDGIYSARTYGWAACVPSDAERCTLTWTPNPPGSYPDGMWRADTRPKCTGSGRGYCWMGLPDDLPMSDFNAGSTSGWLHVFPCRPDEACGVDTSGNLRCYVAPLEPCAGNEGRCDGDDVLACVNGPWLERQSCSQWGKTCDLSCSPDRAPGPACVTRLPWDAEPCAPETFVDTCADGLRLSQCKDCRSAGGACTCYAYPEVCSLCALGTSCQCATMGKGAETYDECVPASWKVCDPDVIAPHCENDALVDCVGVEVRTDCARYGTVCTGAGSAPGCVDASLTVCDPMSTLARCESGKLVACCPESGLLDVDAYRLPCAPGYQVSVDCAAFYSGLRCEFGMCLL